MQSQGARVLRLRHHTPLFGQTFLQQEYLGVGLVRGLRLSALSLARVANTLAHLCDANRLRLRHPRVVQVLNLLYVSRLSHHQRLVRAQIASTLLDSPQRRVRLLTLLHLFQSRLLLDHRINGHLTLV